jgi:putative transposase
MKRSRYTEEQIIGILKEVESGLKVADACRKYGLSSWTVYAWRKKYQGMSVSEAKKLKALEDENRRLKQLVANLSLDNAALKDVLSKNW